MTSSISERRGPDSRSARRRAILHTLRRRQVVRQRRVTVLRTAGLLRAVGDHAARPESRD